MNNQSKELQLLYKCAIASLVALTAFLFVLTLGSARNMSNDTPAINTVTVSGRGEVFAVPDIASFSFSVSADAKNAKEAQDKIKESMDSILDSLKSIQILEKDIKTLDYNVYPKYIYKREICSLTYCPPQNQVQDGFTANHSVVIKVRDTEKVGQAIALVGERGASNVSAVSFTVDEPETLLNQARQKAINEAREKAKILAKDLGVRLGKITNFSDANNYPMPVYGRSMEMTSVMVTDKAPELPMGENKFEVNVMLTYEIK